jgi:hypothetical protein
MRRVRLLYVTLLLGALVALQARALVAQFDAGFVPFAHPPIRVAYSWDMFAIRMDRCSIGWNPPLDVDGQRVARWHDRLPALEFDTVFNESASYGAAAIRACQYKTARATHVTMTCFASDGSSHEYGFDCP